MKRLTSNPRRPSTGVGALAALLVVALGSAAVASASSGLPVSPTYLQATHAYHGLEVRPQSITYTGDGTGFLTGRRAHQAGSRIHWTSWTGHTAHGTGYDQLDNCNPDCAGGTFRAYQVRIELWRPRRLHGTLLFTRLTIWYEHGRPSGEPKHYTFTDSWMGSGFGWWPPTEQGYCVNTYGLKPQAACRNIHSLP